MAHMIEAKCYHWHGILQLLRYRISCKAKTYDNEDIITLFELKANNVKRPGYLNIRAGECFRPAIKCSIKDFIEIRFARYHFLLID